MLYECDADAEEHDDLKPAGEGLKPNSYSLSNLGSCTPSASAIRAITNKLGFRFPRFDAAHISQIDFRFERQLLLSQLSLLAIPANVFGQYGSPIPHCGIEPDPAYSL
jgi:hypothetical protein